MDIFQFPMNTDVAEAILIGHYAVHDKLKWNERPKMIGTVLTTEQAEHAEQIEAIENIVTVGTTEALESGGSIARTE